MPTAFVTGGSGFIGGALIERLRAEGWEVRALARSSGRRAEGARARRRAGAGRPRERADDARGRERGGRGLPRGRQGGGLGRSGGVRASQRARDAERDRRLPRGRRTPARARGHRGGADGRHPAGRRRRGGAAAARLAGALPVEQGQGRAARARRERRRPRDGRDQAALRLGTGGHDAAPGAGRAGAVGALPLGRRRPAPDRHHSPRQHGRGPLAGGDEGARPGASTS